MSIDPRLQERRRDVAEDRAKRNVGRLLKFMSAILITGGAVWLLYSPWLSVSRVDVSGVVESGTYQTLTANDVVAGTPMFKIDSDSIATQLAEDPWVAAVDVDKQWPNLVSVAVVERTPSAWTRTADGWTRRAIDGVAIPSKKKPNPRMGHIDMPSLTDAESSESPFMLGALQFVDALDKEMRPGVVVTIHEDELWATVNGFQVRLGRPVEMIEKARSLTALLRQDLTEGSVLVLIAPTNPSVMTPRPVEEQVDETQEEGEGDAEG